MKLWKKLINNLKNNTRNYMIDRNGRQEMKKIEVKYNNSVFEDIKHIYEYSNEF